jgi:hypothetical protein
MLTHFFSAAALYPWRIQLAEEDAFDSEKDAASVAYNAAVKGAAKVGCVPRSTSARNALARQCAAANTTWT